MAQLRAQLRSTSRALWATQDSRVFHTEVAVCVTSGRTLCCYPTLLSRGRTASSGSCFQGYLGAALFRVVDPRGKVLSAVSAGPTAPGQSPTPVSVVSRVNISALVLRPSLGGYALAL